MLGRIPADTGTIHAITSSGSDCPLVLGGERGDIVLRDRTGRAVSRFEVASTWVGETAVDPAGQWVAALSHRLSIHDAKSGELKREFDARGPKGLAHDPSLHWLAYIDSGSRLALLDTRTMTEIPSVSPLITSTVNALAINPRTSRVAVGTSLGQVMEIDPQTGRTTQSLSTTMPEDGGFNPALGLAYVGNEIIYAGAAGDLHFATRITRTYPSIYLMTTSSKGTLALAGASPSVLLVDSQGNTLGEIEVAAGARVTAMHFDREGTLWIATDFGTLLAFDGTRQKATYSGTGGAVDRICFTPDSCGLAAGKHLMTFYEFEHFAPLGTSRSARICAGRRAGEIVHGSRQLLEIWDAFSATIVESFELPEMDYVPEAIALAPDCRLVAIGGPAGAASYLYDLKDHKLIRLGEITNAVREISWSRNSQACWVIHAGDAGGMDLVRFDRQGQKTLTEQTRGTILSVSCAPDQPLVAWCTGGGGFRRRFRQPPTLYLVQEERHERVAAIEREFLGIQLLSGSRIVGYTSRGLFLSRGLDFLELIEEVLEEIQEVQISPDGRKLALATTTEIRVYALP